MNVEPMTALASVTSEEVEAALDASGLVWAARGPATWVVPAAEGMPCELRVALDKGAVRIEAVLVEWDEADANCVRALTRFLALACDSLRGCHGQLEGNAARLVAQIAPGAEETQLPASLRGMADGCRRSARAARALLTPTLARAFLDFHAGSAVETGTA